MICSGHCLDARARVRWGRRPLGSTDGCGAVSRKFVCHEPSTAKCEEEGRARPSYPREGAASSGSGSRLDTSRHSRDSRCGPPLPVSRRPRVTRPPTPGRDAPGSSTDRRCLVRARPRRAGHRLGRALYFVDVGGTLFFTADDGIHGGSCGGRTAPGGHGPGQGHHPATAYYTSSPSLPDRRGGQLFFTADDGVHGRELWKSDGTKAGTVLVKDITQARVGSEPYSDRRGEHAVLHRRRRHPRPELWKSDGTEAGTVLVKDIRPGARSDPSGPPP